jgi:hypothetical protein
MSKPLFLGAALFCLAGTVLADTDAGLNVIQDLGRLNGQALACGQMAASGQAKTLMIKHAPKTRRYGEAFEAATNTGFLAQGKDLDTCPAAAAVADQLTVLGARLRAALPAAQ